MGQRESLNGAEQVRGPLPAITVLSHPHLTLRVLAQRILYTLTLAIISDNQIIAEKRRFPASLEKFKGLAGGGQHGWSSLMPTQAGPSGRLDPRTV